MWKCKKCGEESEDAFDACWNCGADKDRNLTENRQRFYPINYDRLDKTAAEEAIRS